MLLHLEISCPYCGTSFRIPAEHCGQLAECSECQNKFDIPTMQAIQSAGDEGDGSGVVAAELSTDTVRIDRRNIGMMPSRDEIKEKFGFDTSEYAIPENAKREKKARRLRM